MIYQSRYRMSGTARDRRIACTRRRLLECSAISNITFQDIMTQPVTSNHECRRAGRLLDRWIGGPTSRRTGGPLEGPRRPFKGPRGPFKGPRGPLEGPRGTFKRPRGPLAQYADVSVPDESPANGLAHGRFILGTMQAVL